MSQLMVVKLEEDEAGIIQCYFQYWYEYVFLHSSMQFYKKETKHKGMSYA